MSFADLPQLLARGQSFGRPATKFAGIGSIETDPGRLRAPACTRGLVLRRYHLRVTAARESGHRTHGDGTAVDLVPADGAGQPVWDSSAGRLARDLGWTFGCARSGTRPTCPLVSATQFIGSDGYPSHGSPRTCTGMCPAHIHVS